MQYTGKKVMLESISPRFREEMFAASTPTLVRFMTWPAPVDISETDAFIEKSMQDNETGKTYTFVIIDLVSKQFIGNCSINENIPGKKEVGIWIKESEHGKGYGKDAVQTLMVFAKEVLQLDSLLYRADLENIGSQKLCESVGGVFSGMSTMPHKTEPREMPMKDYIIQL